MTTTARPKAPDRRAAIVAAAAELFAANGFSGAGIDAIGAAAGVTGPAIYRHFNGKDALLYAVMAQALTAFEMSDEIIAAGPDAMAAHAVGGAFDNPAPLVTYLKERHRLRGDTGAELARCERQLFQPWSDAIRATYPELSPKEAARRALAITTAMSEVASKVRGVPRPRLKSLVSESMMAVVAVPPVPTQSQRSQAVSWSVPASRRERILEEAMRLFRERGFHDVTMDDIGEAAGITGPTIYFHYNSKSEVLTDAHERASIRVSVAVQDAVRSAMSASDALDHLARAQLRIAADHRDLILVTSREMAPLDSVDVERFVQRAIEIIDLWATVLGELRPELTESEARAVVLGVFPLMNHLTYALNDPDDGVPLVRAWAMGLSNA